MKSQRQIRVILMIVFLSGFYFNCFAEGVAAKVEMDYQVVKQQKNAVVHILVTYQAKEVVADTSKPRPVLNLDIVIDRSGSMSEKGKIEYAKEAAKKVVESLGAQDILSIVEYDDQISVMWPATRSGDPEVIKQKIEMLAPRGSTNLTAGMMEGVKEVRKNVGQELLNRVILLSDGLANTGITAPGQIVNLVKQTRADNITISTMGLGLNYNEDLMQLIAENGGGDYYFIENPAQMTRIFQQELAQLFSVVAKQSRVEFTPSYIVKKTDVFGYIFTKEDKKIKIEMPDFYSNEKRVLLYRLELESENAGTYPLGDFLFSYFDIEENCAKTVKLANTIKVSADENEVQASKNQNVIVEASLIEADNRHEEYVRLYEKGNKTEALAKITALTTDLTVMNRDYQDVKINKKLEALKMEAEEIRQAEQNNAYKASYLKKSKERFLLSQKGKRGKSFLQEGDSGYEVEQLQKALQQKGLYQGPIDGKFTADLKDALKRFQVRENLNPDGIAGPETLKLLQLY